MHSIDCFEHSGAPVLFDGQFIPGKNIYSMPDHLQYMHLRLAEIVTLNKSRSV